MKMKLDVAKFCGRRYILDKVFKNGQSKICGRQPLKNLKGYGNCREGNLCRFFNAFV